MLFQNEKKKALSIYNKTKVLFIFKCVGKIKCSMMMRNRKLIYFNIYLRNTQEKRQQL
jgi:hypothetical protein